MKINNIVMSISLTDKIFVTPKPYLENHVPGDDENLLPTRALLLHNLFGPEAEGEVGDGAEAVGVVGAAVVDDVVRGKIRGRRPSLVVLELVRVRHQINLSHKIQFSAQLVKLI